MVTESNDPTRILKEGGAVHRDRVQLGVTESNDPTRILKAMG